MNKLRIHSGIFQGFFILLLPCLAAFFFMGCSTSSPDIYMTVNPKEGDAFLKRATLDGNEKTILNAEGHFLSIDVDRNAKKIYFIEEFFAGRLVKIRRADLNGSNAEDVVIGIAMPFALALDTMGGKIYWTDMVGRRIQRANLNGTDVQDLVSDLDRPSGIAVDPRGDMVYWIDSGGNAIQRARLDGSDIQTLVTELSLPTSLALDVAHRKMYWTNVGDAKIQRANFDGTDVEDLVIAGLGLPHGISLDVKRGKMYWADIELDKIQRANLDGSNVQDVITGIKSPLDIALVY